MAFTEKPNKRVGITKFIYVMSNSTKTGALQLEYNYPLDVPQNFSATCQQTSQTESILQIENESTSNKALLAIQYGDVSEQHTINPNTAEPFTMVKNFNGAKLNIINISTRPATVKVTLRNT